MAWISRMRHIWRRWRRRQQVEDDLDDEVKADFDILVVRDKSKGLTPEEAEHVVRRQFEGPEQVKYRVREARVGTQIETTLQDVEYAWRSLRKSPGSTLKLLPW